MEDPQVGLFLIFLASSFDLPQFLCSVLIEILQFVIKTHALFSIVIHSQVKHLVVADICNLVKLIDVFLLYKLLKGSS